MIISKQIIPCIAFLSLAAFLPAMAQDDEPTPKELGAKMADMIFGQDNAPANASATQPKEGCSEDSVQTCVDHFMTALDQLDANEGGTGLYSGGQYDMAALLSGAAACDYGDGRSCYLLATLYTEPPAAGRAPDPAAALPYYQKACDLDFGAGCGAVVYYINSIETDMSRAAVNATARKGCMLDDASSCTYYGYYASQGVGMEIDPMLSFAAFMKACDLSSARGCGNIGALYEGGVFAPQNIRRAASYYDFGCELGDVNSCNAMIGLHGPDGTLPDAEKVTTAQARACEIDTGLCAE